MSSTDKAAIQAAIEATWLARATRLYPNPRTVKATDAEVEFFLGAMAALQAVFGKSADSLTDYVPPAWVIGPMSGKPIIKR